MTLRGSTRESLHTMNAFELSDLDRQRVQGGKLYLEFLRAPTLSVGAGPDTRALRRAARLNPTVA